MYQVLKCNVTILAFAFFTCCAHASSSNILFSQTTEDENPMPGQDLPSKAMVQSILRGSDLSKDEQEAMQAQREYLDSCLSTQKPKSSRRYETMFRSAPLPKTEGMNPAFFVRPATEPFCGAFYGAHLFQFWIMTASGEIIFHSGADMVTVFKTLNNGRPDLEVQNCTVDSCWISLMVFDGTSYKPQKCQKTTFGKNGKEHTTRISCRNH